MPDVVSIPLPPEPPRDRVIEAVDKDGTVRARWAYGKRGWTWDDGSGWWAFGSITDYARERGLSLQHVPAEAGEQT